MHLVKALFFSPALILRGLLMSPGYLAFLHFGAPAFVILTAPTAVDQLPVMFVFGLVIFSYIMLVWGFIRFWLRGYKASAVKATDGGGDS